MIRDQDPRISGDNVPSRPLRIPLVSAEARASFVQYHARDNTWDTYLQSVVMRTKAYNPNLYRLIVDVTRQYDKKLQQPMSVVCISTMSLLEYQAHAYAVDPWSGLPRDPYAYALPILTKNAQDSLRASYQDGDKWGQKLEEVMLQVHHSNPVLASFINDRMEDQTRNTGIPKRDLLPGTFTAIAALDYQGEIDVFNATFDKWYT